MNKIKTYGALAVMASVLFASCAPEVDDTKANYAEAEKAVTTTYDSQSRSVMTGSVYCTTASITQAGEDTRLSVEIESYARLNMDSVVNALNFYTLCDNSANKFYYPVRTDVLPKAIVRAEEPDVFNGLSTTTIEFSVDTSSVSTEKIALYVDAAKLKDKSGNPVLNLDSDDKAGEETDSYIQYITVYKTAAGSSPTSLNYKYSEEFGGLIPLQYLEDSIDVDDLYDTDGNYTGKIRFTVDAPINSLTVDPSTGATTATYDGTLSGTLAQIYTLQTKAVGETSWKTVSLSFTFHDAADATNPYASIAANTYTADTDALAYGTQWRLVRKWITSGSAPSWFKDIFGHEGWFFYCGSKEYTEVEDSGTMAVYLESPEYIYDFGTGSATTFEPTVYTESDASTAQAGLLGVTEPTVVPAEWIITPTVDLASAEDFIVTNENNKIVASTVKVYTNESDEIQAVKVALKDKNVGGAFRLWVGSGVVLKDNVNIKYPTQVKFGLPADSTKGDVSGYVQLNEVAVFGTAIYSSASDDISEYYVAYVSNGSYKDYQYYFKAGKTYKVQWKDSCNANAALNNAGYSPATDAYLYVYDSNMAQKGYTDDGTVVSVTCTVSGIYTVRILSRNDRSGYAAIRVYTTD